jgi:hypothetical protein
MYIAQFESAHGIAEFQLETKSIPRHGAATNGTAATGSRPTPDAHVISPWKHAGVNRGSRFPT